MIKHIVVSLSEHKYMNAMAKTTRLINYCENMQTYSDKDEECIQIVLRNLKWLGRNIVHEHLETYPIPPS